MNVLQIEIGGGGKGATRIYVFHNMFQCREATIIIQPHTTAVDRLCGLVVRVPGCRSRGPGAVTGVTRFSEK
jgi:hypothetical protein